MRKNAFTWVIALTFLIGELHTFPFFSDKGLENWILRAYKPMTQAWNMFYLEQQIKFPLYVLAFILWKPTKVNRTTLITLGWAGVLDTVMYFYDFKKPMYFGSFYVWLLFIWFLVYYWRSEKGVFGKALFPQTWKK